MKEYEDRYRAGKILARELQGYVNQSDTLVLALPRGGVPVAYEVALALSLPLDVFMVRKLGVPGHEELAMGAISTGGYRVFNQDIIESLGISKSTIEAAIAEQQQELQRRERVYRGSHPVPEIKGKTIILVDDGIATGATIRVALKALQHQNPTKLIVAVPVASPNTCDELAEMADEVICPLQPEDLRAVGVWYRDFSQTTDKEVIDLLEKANRRKL